MHFKKEIAEKFNTVNFAELVHQEEVTIPKAIEKNVKKTILVKTPQAVMFIEPIIYSERLGFSVADDSKLLTALYAPIRVVPTKNIRESNLPIVKAAGIIPTKHAIVPRKRIPNLFTPTVSTDLMRIKFYPLYCIMGYCKYNVNC